MEGKIAENKLLDKEGANVTLRANPKTGKLEMHQKFTLKLPNGKVFARHTNTTELEPTEILGYLTELIPGNFDDMAKPMVEGQAYPAVAKMVQPDYDA